MTSGSRAILAHVGRGLAVDLVPPLADRNILSKSQDTSWEIRAVNALRQRGGPELVPGEDDLERASLCEHRAGRLKFRHRAHGEELLARRP